jgi:hypothetical protein
LEAELGDWLSFKGRLAISSVLEASEVNASDKKKTLLENTHETFAYLPAVLLAGLAVFSAPIHADVVRVVTNGFKSDADFAQYNAARAENENTFPLSLASFPSPGTPTARSSSQEQRQCGKPPKMPTLHSAPRATRRLTRKTFSPM